MTTSHDFGGVLGRPLNGLWTLSFGLSQFHGHGSWLMCEMALGVAHWDIVDDSLVILYARGIYY